MFRKSFDYKCSRPMNFVLIIENCEDVQRSVIDNYIDFNFKNKTLIVKPSGDNLIYYKFEFENNSRIYITLSLFFQLVNNKDYLLETKSITEISIAKSDYCLFWKEKLLIEKCWIRDISVCKIFKYYIKNNDCCLAKSSKSSVKNNNGLINVYNQYRMYVGFGFVENSVGRYIYLKLKNKYFVKGEMIIYKNLHGKLEVHFREVFLIIMLNRKFNKNSLFYRMPKFLIYKILRIQPY